MNKITFILTAALLQSAVFAQQVADKKIQLDEAYGDAFSNYRPYITTPKKKQPDPQPPVAAKPPNQEPKGEQKVDVEWLIKNFPILEKRAINDPSDVNISAYLYAKRIILDKGQRFEEAHMAMINADPLLNENNRVPYASTGALTIRNADYLGQQQAAREMGKVGGLVAFVDGTCRFCAQQMPILNMLKNNFGVETLVVSIDGRRPKGYGGPLAIDNGLYKKLQLKLTPAVVYVPRPKSYKGEMDPNEYLIISQGFYAADELTKLLAYAGHNRKILSEDTMRDLSVWSRGVASTQDLGSLTLDPNNPASFKEKLQPILQKQYK